MFKGNGIYKIASVIIAVALMIYVNSERNPFEVKTYTLPLQALNKEPKLLIKNMPATVQVEAKGPRESLLSVSPRDLEAVVDLAGKESGSHSLKVVVRPAPGAVIPPDISFTPLKLSVGVTLESEARRTTLLTPVFLRPAPSGYSYGTPTVVPPRAAYSGPSDAVNRIASLQVLVDAEMLPGKPLDGVFPIQAVDRMGQVVPEIKTDPASARVRTEPQRMPGEKEVLVSANIDGTPAPGMKISAIVVVPQSVVLTGNPDTLAKVNFVTTQQIQINGATSSVVRSVPINLPDGVTIAGSRRARVEIVIVPRN